MTTEKSGTELMMQATSVTIGEARIRKLERDVRDLRLALNLALQCEQTETPLEVWIDIALEALERSSDSSR